MLVVLGAGSVDEVVKVTEVVVEVLVVVCASVVMVITVDVL